MPSLPTLVLFGVTACNNEARVRRLLRTEWNIIPLRDEADVPALREALRGADALIALRWQAGWKDAAGQLRLIQAPGAGTDSYDTAAMPVGCTLCNVYEHATPIGEYVMGMLVALTTRLVPRDRLLRTGIWEGSGRRDGEPHQELAGRTIGLVGYGTIGHEVARRAIAFDLKVCAVRANPSAPVSGVPIAWVGGPDRLRELMTTSDFLVVCCPLTKDTSQLINQERLTWLKPSAYLINVSRAEVVEEQALYSALKEGRLAGAALDVWYRYPASENEQMLPATAPFHELDNVLMTPHLSAWTHGMIERRWTKMVGNLDALATQTPLQNVVALR